LFYENDNLKEAYNFMSLGDLNKARIYSRQNWVFFKYFISLGIISPALVPKKDHFTFKISYPQSIKMKAKEVSEFSKNKKVAQILSKVFRGSNYKISAEIFLYKFFFKDAGFVNYVVDTVTDEELEFLETFFKFKLPKKIETQESNDYVDDKRKEKKGGAKEKETKEIIKEESSKYFDSKESKSLQHVESPSKKDVVSTQQRKLF
jgi:hypothetical protein